MARGYTFLFGCENGVKRVLCECEFFHYLTSQNMLGEDAFEDFAVIGGYGFGPLAFAVFYVFAGGLVGGAAGG